jgi:hypothetical protein
MILTLRETKGLPLTNTEMDNNFKLLRDQLAVLAGVDTTIKDDIVLIKTAGYGVKTVNGKPGDVVLKASDIVDGVITVNGQHGYVNLVAADFPTLAPIQSPVFTGAPSMSTSPITRTNSGTLATTSFTHQLILETAGYWPKIDKISKGTSRSIFVLCDGKLYAAHSTIDILLYEPYTSPGPAMPISTVSGRVKTQIGIENITGCGVANFWHRVLVPTLYRIKDFDCVSEQCAWALDEQGNLFTWGDGAHGLLGAATGTGTVGDPYVALSGTTLFQPILQPILVKTGVRRVFDHPSNCQYSSSARTMFIQTEDDKIWGCGFNGYGQLGLGAGAITDPAPGTGVRTAGIPAFTEITTFSTGSPVVRFFNIGGQFGAKIAQRADDSIWMAGWNGEGHPIGSTHALAPHGDGGQLGLDHINNVHTFTCVTNATNSGRWGGDSSTVGGGAGIIVSAHTAGSSRNASSTGLQIHSRTLCILRKKANGETSLWTCGGNKYGQIGNGNFDALKDDNGSNESIKIPYQVGGPDSSNPTLIAAFKNIKQVAMFGGEQHIIQVLTNANEIYAWGCGANWTLGGNTSADKATPTLIMTSTSVPTKLFSDGMSGSGDDGWICTSWIQRHNRFLYYTGYDPSQQGTHTGIHAFLPQPREPDVVVDIGWFGTDPNDRTYVFVTAKDIMPNMNSMYAWGGDASGQIFGSLQTNGSLYPATVEIPVAAANIRG